MVNINNAPITKHVTIQVADFLIEIIFHQIEDFVLYDKFSDYLEYLYRDFIVDNQKKVNFSIHVIDEIRNPVVANDNILYIDFCRDINSHTALTYYSISVVQFQIILKRALISLLSRNKGFILHGSASLISNHCVVFLGREGAGKTTITSLISDKHPRVADDSVIIRYKDKRFKFYQSPFIEKGKTIYISNKSIEINKVIFLKKSQECKLISIKSKHVIFEKIMKQLHVINIEKSTIKSVQTFIKKNDFFYNLLFTKSKEELSVLFHQV